MKTDNDIFNNQVISTGFVDPQELIDNMRAMVEESYKPKQQYIIFNEQAYRNNVDDLPWEDFITLDSVIKCEDAIDQSQYVAKWPQVITESREKFGI